MSTHLQRPEKGPHLRAVRGTGPVKTARSAPASDAPRCALTVDLEDWYQSSIDLDAPITDRVVRNTDRLAKLLDDCDVKVTFFVQGMVAEKYPGLVRELLDAGHEIQSHGYSHRPLYGMDRKALRQELDRARKTVEDACGVSVTSFRAPDFSILRRNLWALEVLAEMGFDLDSSIFPIAMSRYGIDSWSLAPRQVALVNGLSILEAPVAVTTLFGRRVPVAGGGYFRLLPQAVLERSLASVIAEKRPAIVYCHPYEFNPDELGEYRGQVSFGTRLYQGLGRAAFVRRVRHLLEALPFGRLDQVIETWRSEWPARQTQPKPLTVVSGEVRS